MATPSGPQIQGKIVYVIKNTTLANIVSDTQACIDFINANVANMMFNLQWVDYGVGTSETIYLYDFGAHPIYNFSNGGLSDVVILQHTEFLPTQGSAGYGVTDLLDDIQPGMPGTTPIQVCAWKTWTIYINVVPTLHKQINRILYNFNEAGASGITISASMGAAWYNGAGAGAFPFSPFPVPQSVFFENLDTIPTPPDFTGPHPGQVLQAPIPSMLGIQQVETVSPVSGFTAPYNLFGEYFESN